LRGVCKIEILVAFSLMVNLSINEEIGNRN